MELQKGASNDVIKNAKEFVRTYGKETLRKVAKLHFRITAQIVD
jgi:ribonuclease HIII